MGFISPSLETSFTLMLNEQRELRGPVAAALKLAVMRLFFADCFFCCDIIKRWLQREGGMLKLEA